MNKVLITGASGFIGSHLAETLVAQGDEVTCLVRKTSAVDRLRLLDVELAYGDVTDRETLPAAVAGKQTVYHLAGCTRAKRVAEFFRVNEQGVGNVAEVCAEQTSPPVLLVVSSLAAAGPAPDGRLRHEADPSTPVSNYGRSKLAGERKAVALADWVPTTIVRPPIVVGEADRLAWEMFSSIARFGVHVVPGLGRKKYSVIHANDLANLLILAAGRGSRLKMEETGTSPRPSGYYFAASDEHPTYAELGRMVAAALGRRRVLIIPTPPRAVWVIAAMHEVLSRLRRRLSYLCIDKAREIRAGSWLCSPQAAKDELGFSVAAPLAERLQQTAQWYRQQGWL